MTDLLAASGLSVTTFTLAAAMTFGAAAIRGLTGFGMAIILVPLLGMVIEPSSAVVLAILLQLLIGPVGLRTILADGDRATALPIAGIAMLATPLGLIALQATSPDVARLIIASVAIGAFVLVLLPMRPDGHRPSRTEIGLTGVAAGILTGFAAMPGPPVVPFYLRQRIEPRVARASMMLVFFGTAIAGSLSAFALGAASVQTAVLAGALFVPMLIGNWAGGLAFGRVPSPLWRSFVAVILGIAGVSAVLRLW
ncbi:MAG: sulfite exporter TauE/SafE family protein [Pseudomonadota bacterium]